MKNLWKEPEAHKFIRAMGADPADVTLAQRVYTSRLLGCEPDLVLHGGGNTSVKVDRQWPDGSTRRTLHVKGSGWDLSTIEAPGLPAVDLRPLLAARQSGGMSDPEMVALLRASLMDADAPNPSVETLLHAFIPYAFVDHSHALSVLVLANQPDCERIASEVYGDRVAFVPYVMPGYDLSIEAARICDRNPDCQGLFLANHGLFTYADTAEEAYRLMIEFTTMAEDHLAARGASIAPDLPHDGTSNPTFEERLTTAIGKVFPTALPEPVLDYRSDANVRRYTGLADLDDVARRGTVTPDHVIRIKPFPLICEPEDDEALICERLDAFAADYKAYFERNAPHADEPKTMLDPVPKLVLLRGAGLYGVDKNAKNAGINADLAVQTARAVVAAQTYGAFRPIKEPELFDMEYWSLEQAKLAKG